MGRRVAPVTSAGSVLPLLVLAVKVSQLTRLNLVALQVLVKLRLPATDDPPDRNAGQVAGVDEPVHDAQFDAELLSSFCSADPSPCYLVSFAAL